jgi:starch phosphorylase
MDATAIKRSLCEHLTYSIGKDVFMATERDCFYAGAYVIRERLF